MVTDFLSSGAGRVSFPVRRRGAPLVLVALVSLSGCSSSAQAPAPEASYGSLPTFLPSNSVQNDSPLIGTTSHPAVTSQGDAVQVQLDDNAVTATVTGPQVPGEGLPYQAEATTCTWTVTLVAPRADLPIAASDFTTLDHLGRVYHPTPVPGQPKPPAVLAKGKTTTFELRTVMNTGEGLMRWSPGNAATVASWDFTVEND